MGYGPDGHFPRRCQGAGPVKARCCGTTGGKRSGRATHAGGPRGRGVRGNWGGGGPGREGFRALGARTLRRHGVSKSSPLALACEASARPGGLYSHLGKRSMSETGPGPGHRKRRSFQHCRRSRSARGPNRAPDRAYRSNYAAATSDERRSVPALFRRTKLARIHTART